jgi:hypothetical protein
MRNFRGVELGLTKNSLGSLLIEHAINIYVHFYHFFLVLQLAD